MFVSITNAIELTTPFAVLLQLRVEAWVWVEAWAEWVGWEAWEEWVGCHPGATVLTMSTEMLGSRDACTGFGTSC